MTARPIRSLLFAFLALLTLGLGAAQAQATTGSPSQIVTENSKRILQALQTRRSEFRADPAELRRFVLSELDQVFDRVYSAQLVLGRHARGADQAEVQAFADALAENLMSRYGSALLDVDANVDIKVIGETALREGKITRVSTQILRKQGTPVPVDYYFRNDAGTWRLFDVAVEGVSYVQTFRTQFDEALRGKTLAQVTADLRAGKVQANADASSQR